jgi:hypothetical protein
MHRRFSVACLLVGLAVVARLPAMAHAKNVGQAYDGLPGLHRVPIAEPSDARLTAALSMGYGVTEARAGESAAHQRISTIAAIGVSPLPHLQLAMSAAARYDHHPDDGQGSDSGTVIDPRASARWVETFDPSFALGLEIGAWFPGSEDAARTLRATSPHAALVGTLRAEALTLGGRAGYRLDRSARAAPAVAQLRPGDRLALGLSDFDAALVGLGAAYAVGDVQLLAEGSAELLLGEGAPALLDSPIGASGGARYAVNDVWSIELIGEASFSGRPALAAGRPLVPVQPRFAAFAGVRFRWPFAQPDLAPDLGPAPAPAPLLIDLRIDVRYSASSEAGPPRATLEQDGKQRVATAINASELAFEGITPGKARLSVEAEGYTPALREIEIDAATSPQRVTVELVAIAPQAQLRGLVRSLGGRGLRARIRVDPLGIEVLADEAGFFELDVPAGRYEVQIQAEGYQAQQKRVVVEKDGVVILNADLLPKEP